MVVAVAAVVQAEPRGGSLVVGVVHRNDAPLAQLDESHDLEVAWTGAIGGWRALAAVVALDARAELFGVTVRVPRDGSRSVRAHVGAEVAIVLDPTGSIADGLLRGVRIGAGLDVVAHLAGARADDRGGLLVPRLSIGWVDVLAVGPDEFPFRCIRLEGGLTWSPGTLLVTLAIGLEAEPLGDRRD